MTTTALTIGTFDRFHQGHLRLIERALTYADFLFVGVNSDKFVHDYKGAWPIETLRQRVNPIEEIEGVEDVFPNDGPGIDLIRQVMPDFLVIGSDWLDNDYTKQIGTTADELAEMEITVVFLPRTPGFSSSDGRDT